LLQWVREQTVFVPYSGVLRGPCGVLMDRVGNDLDRSLLLAQVVSLSGYEVRLVRSQLTEAEAHVRLIPASTRPIATFGPLDPPKELAEVNQWSDQQAQSLIPLLPTPKLDDVDADQLAASRDHWWVQYNNRQKWADLDPASPKAEMGGRAGTGDLKTFACPAGNLVANIPKDLLHQVVFRVVVERWDSGKLVEQPAVEWALSTWDSPATHVRLSHRIEGAGTKPSLGEDAKSIRAKLLGQTRWRPVLSVNGRAYGSMVFGENGVLERQIFGAQKLGTGVGTAFGTFHNEVTGSGDSKKTSVLTAEFLDIIVTVPGRPLQTVRCEVFDSLGPAARAAANQSKPFTDWSETQRLARAGALNGMSDNLMVSCGTPHESVIHEITRRVRKSRAALLAIAADPKNGKRAQLIQMLAPDTLESFSFSRSGRFFQADSTYIDRPNVLRALVRWQPKSDGAMQLFACSDLALNAVASSAPSAPERLAAVLRRGIADSGTEGIAIGDWPPSPVDGRAPNNTRAVFQLASQKSAPTICLRAAADLDAAKITLPPDTRTRILADLTAGQIVAIATPTSNFAPTGWWRIDPLSGAAVGVMDNGFRGDAVEKPVVECIPQVEIEAIESTDINAIRAGQSVEEGTAINAEKAGRAIESGGRSHSGGYPRDFLFRVQSEAEKRGISRMGTGENFHTMSDGYRNLLVEMCDMLMF
jgi:hypothetical protein